MNKIEQKIMDLKDFEEAKITVNKVSTIQELNKLWRRAHELEDDNQNTYGELRWCDFVCVWNTIIADIQYRLSCCGKPAIYGCIILCAAYFSFM